MKRLLILGVLLLLPTSSETRRLVSAIRVEWSRVTAREGTSRRCRSRLILALSLRMDRAAAAWSLIRFSRRLTHREVDHWTVQFDL